MLYHFLGGLADNYLVLIIGLIIFTKLISIPLKHVQKKQNAAKIERDTKIEELKENTNGDRDALTEEIYKYYQEIDYNPVKLFLSKAVIFVLNFTIIFGVLGVFQPISNFSNLDDNAIEVVTTTYQENFETDAYVEIDILHQLDKLEPLLDGKVSRPDVDSLHEVKDKFMLGSLDTTIIPTKSEQSIYLCLPALVLVLTVLIQVLSNLRKQTKTELIISVIIACISFGLTALFVFKTPIIVCFYFLINDMYSLALNTFNLTKQKRGTKNGKTRNEENN